MNSFIQKKLAVSKSLGEILREGRQQNNWSLEELSLKTEIAVKYLEALERGRYHLIPGDVYISQFLKKLAKLYNFNEKSFHKIYQQELAQQPKLSSLPAKKPLAFSWLSPKNFKYLIILLIILAFGGYFGWEIKNIFQQPKLTIYSPLPQTITEKPFIEISGKTEPEATVEINQQQILAQPDGTFTQSVDLSMGLNIFTVSAVKKHSKANEQTISILRKPAEENAEINIDNNLQGRL